ncbi:MAG: hypothetical protein ACFFCW_21120 [Candidatus Hodarchaeota archaeon]
MTRFKDLVMRACHLQNCKPDDIYDYVTARSELFELIHKEGQPDG